MFVLFCLFVFIIIVVSFYHYYYYYDLLLLLLLLFLLLLSSLLLFPFFFKFPISNYATRPQKTDLLFWAFAWTEAERCRSAVERDELLVNSLNRQTTAVEWALLLYTLLHA